MNIYSARWILLMYSEMFIDTKLSRAFVPIRH